MTTYQTYIIVDNSQKIILADLPFQEGTELEITIKEVNQKRLDTANKLKDLFKELQSLPSSEEITETEIAEEINAYHRGE